MSTDFILQGVRELGVRFDAVGVRHMRFCAKKQSGSSLAAVNCRSVTVDNVCGDRFVAPGNIGSRVCGLLFDLVRHGVWGDTAKLCGVLNGLLDDVMSGPQEVWT